MNNFLKYLLSLFFYKNKRIWYLESIYELKSKYSGSVLGPFWIVMSNLLLIIILSIVFSYTFYSDYKSILPKLAIGLILWNYVSTNIISSCLCLINNNHNILNYNHSYATYIIKSNTTNFFIFLHNVFLIIGIIFYYKIDINMNIYILILTFPLFLINIFFMTYILAIINLRFRDVEQITSSLMMVFFYFTPILWDISLVTDTKFEIFINFNIFYHLLELIRLPLVGQTVSNIHIIICALLLLTNFTICYILHKKYSKKISLIV